MPNISLTDFVDFVAKSGRSKLTAVRRFKHRPEYEPAFDFWKKLREGIQEFHRNNIGDKDWLDGISSGLNDRNKILNYPGAINQYKRFLGRKEITWFDPPQGVWTHDNLEVRINPELGLVINNERNIIKLYFKSEKLAQSKISVVQLLMFMSLTDTRPEDKFCILEVQRSKLYDTDLPDIDELPLLQGEAASLLTMWDALP